MEAWIKIIEFLSRIGILPIVVLLLAIPGGLLLFAIGAKKYLFPGFGALLRSSFNIWISEQQERTKTEVKLEERLSDIAEQLKQLVAVNMDNRKYIDEVLEETKEEHQQITIKLDRIYDTIAGR